MTMTKCNHHLYLASIMASLSSMILFFRWQCKLKGAHRQNIFYFNYWANRSTIILYRDCASAWELIENSKTHKLFSSLSCRFTFKGVNTSWLFATFMYIDHKIVKEFLYCNTLYWGRLNKSLRLFRICHVLVTCLIFCLLQSLESHSHSNAQKFCDYFLDCMQMHNKLQNNSSNVG
jgi:hypothetical protein